MTIIDLALYPEISGYAIMASRTHDLMRMAGHESYQLGPYTTNDVVTSLHADVDALREELRQQKESAEWRTIDTAPRTKDAQYLIWDGAEISSVFYDPDDADAPHWAKGEYHEYWYQESDSGRRTSFAPTHWMPLPTPPAP